jgi:hypothetical protein
MNKFVGERRALAAAVLAFYAFLFLLVSLAPPPGWGACFGALALVYGGGFFGLVAGYFWARWYAIGLGMSGLISAGVSILQIGPEPALLFYGATHGVVSLILWGGPMAAWFDGRREWRERYHLDEHGTHRLGKAIIRVGISLPYMVMYALAPREDGAAAALALGTVALVAVGVWGLLRLRTWSLAALATASVALVASLPLLGDATVRLSSGYGIHMGAAAVGAAIALAAAVAPFARPAARYLRRGGHAPGI